jgi:hypothetical protein
MRDPWNITANCTKSGQSVNRAVYRFRWSSPPTYDPDFPVEEGIFDEFVLVRLRTAVVVELESFDDKSTLILGEELGSVGVIVQHPERGNGDNDGSNTLEDENPSLKDEASCQMDSFNEPYGKRKHTHPS